MTLVKKLIGSTLSFLAVACLTVGLAGCSQTTTTKKVEEKKTTTTNGDKKTEEKKTEEKKNP